MPQEKSDASPRLLLTGASGFVGRHLLARLHAEHRFETCCAFRDGASAVASTKHVVIHEGLGPDTDWAQGLHGITHVIHAAGRAHVMGEPRAAALAAFRAVNTAGTARLAQQAAAAGVRRFIFISSVKVHGEETPPGQAFTEASPTEPSDPYGISKYEAESELLRIAAQTGMEVVVIRPPLIYGSGVRANFLALAKAVASGLPLPLGAVHNRRSLVSVDNLIDLIVLTLEHPEAANQSFLVSDGADLSTADLVRAMARAMNRPLYLLAVPVWALKAAASLAVRRDVAQRLCGNLQIDITKARSLLNWQPPVSVDEGLRRALAELDTA